MKVVFSRIFACLFASFLLSLSAPAVAQSGTWVRSSGGYNQDLVEDILTDASGNVYITGTYSDSIWFDTLTVLPCGGLTDMFVAKYNANGQVIWAKQVGGGKLEAGKELAWDTYGRLLVGGQFEDSLIIGFDTLFNDWSLKNTDIMVLCLDKNGNTQWGLTAGHRGGDYLGGLQGLADGSVLISGLFRIELDNPMGGTWFDTTIAVRGLDDIFLLRKDSTDKHHHFIANAGGKQREQATDLTAVGDSVVYITGWMQDTVWVGDSIAFVVTSGAEDAFLAKYTTSGDFRWMKTGGGPYSDYADGIASDALGNVYVVGSFDSVFTFGSTTVFSSGEVDGLIMKLNSAGTVQWTRTLGGAGYDNIKSIRINDGKIVIAGFYQGDATFGSLELHSTDSSDQEAFFAEIDASGNFLWATRVGGVSLDQAVAAEACENGFIYGTGTYLGTANFGQIAVSSLGSDDMFVVKMDAAGKVSLDEFGEKTLVLSGFPNPAADQTIIEFTVDVAGITELYINDISGKSARQIYNGTLSAGTHRLSADLSGLTPGVYVVSLSNAGRTGRWKLVVAR